MKVNGFDIRISSGGGKAGKKRNKTGTIQVCEPMGEGFLLRKSFRYKIGSKESLEKAKTKAIQFAGYCQKTKLNLNKK